MGVVERHIDTFDRFRGNCRQRVSCSWTATSSARSASESGAWWWAKQDKTVRRRGCPSASQSRFSESWSLAPSLAIASKRSCDPFWLEAPEAIGYQPSGGIPYQCSGSTEQFGGPRLTADEHAPCTQHWILRWSLSLTLGLSGLLWVWHTVRVVSPSRNSTQCIRHTSDRP